MDLQSFYYFQEISKDLNITKTASRLFISQQTLSNHVKRLEEYFDTPLLYRKPKLSLTYAGEFVLSFSNYIANKERNLNDVIRDIKNTEKGLIRMGASVMRTNLVLPHILDVFSNNYPKVELRISNNNSQELINDTLEGTLDLAIVLLYQDEEKHSERELNYIPLIDEEIYLCVTDRILRKYYGDDVDELKAASKSGADLANFSRLPFCMLNNQMGKTVDLCFEAAGFTPIVHTVSSNMQVTSTFGTRGLAACFVSKTSLLSSASDFSSKDLNFFPLLLNDKKLHQTCYFIHRKDRYLSQYTKHFADLIVKLFAYISAVPTEKILKPDILNGLNEYLHNINTKE